MSADELPSDVVGEPAASDAGPSDAAVPSDAALPSDVPPPGDDATLSAANAGGHSPGELSRAMQAFKKRLKLTQLDSESKMGYGPMTGGRPSGIVAITPPNQFPRSVWDALVAQGKLKKGSQGQYELVKK